MEVRPDYIPRIGEIRRMNDVQLFAWQEELEAWRDACDDEYEALDVKDALERVNRRIREL